MLTIRENEDIGTLMNCRILSPFKTIVFNPMARSIGQVHKELGGSCVNPKGRSMRAGPG